MVSSSVAKDTIDLETWKNKLDQQQSSKEELNKLILDYLVVEGYKEAAENFILESNTQSDGVEPAGSLGNRTIIRKAIQIGDIQKAIELVNDLDPEILDKNPGLYFHLQQQKLIELIREKKSDEALDFLNKELSSFGEENQAYLDELEKTLVLLAFDDHSKSPMAHLLDISQRHKTASELNAAILSNNTQDKDAKLPNVLKLLSWAQDQLSNVCDYPEISYLGSSTLSFDNGGIDDSTGSSS